MTCFSNRKVKSLSKLIMYYKSTFIISNFHQVSPAGILAGLGVSSAVALGALGVALATAAATGWAGLPLLCS